MRSVIYRIGSDPRGQLSDLLGQYILIVVGLALWNLFCSVFHVDLALSLSFFLGVTLGHIFAAGLIVACSWYTAKKYREQY